MTITNEQLDELERFARSERKAGWPKCAVDFDVTLQLVAIARAGLAFVAAQHENESSGDALAVEEFNALLAATQGTTNERTSDP